MLNDGKRGFLTRNKTKKNLILLMLALPGMLFVIVFNYLPMPGIVIAFKDYRPLRGIWGSAWNGLDNFRFFFASQDAFRTIRNTVAYSTVFLILDILFGVMIALILYYIKSNRSVRAYHSIIMLPRFLSIVIVSFIVYALFSSSYGLANKLMSILGRENVNWYGTASAWPYILTATKVWMSLGTGCLFYYSALTAIDPSLFEAARIDGANALDEVRHICLPSLLPIISILTILGIGNLFSGDFGLFYTVPKNQGILYETTDIINTYVFRALQGGSLSKSTAVNLFQSLVGLILVLTSNGIIRKISPENSMF